MIPVRFLRAAVANSPTLRSALVALRGPYQRSEHHVETGASVDRRYSDASNDWSTMKTFSDAGRYGALSEWIRRLAPRGPVLDIGAGNGLLAEALAGQEVDYVGVDFAAATIEQVRSRLGRPGRRFEAGDATTYVPERQYPLIIFNDMLYYLEQPVKHVQRLSAYLEPGGHMIVAMFLGWRQVQLLHELVNSFEVVEQSFILNGEGRSFVQLVLKPR